LLPLEKEQTNLGQCVALSTKTERSFRPDLEEPSHGILRSLKKTVEALIFFRLLLSNCLNWKINCDDHSSLSSTTAVHI